MVVLFIVVGDFIIKCVAASGTASCVAISPLAFAAFATAGVLELAFELKGFINIFVKRDRDEDK
jgi:hypothetical protein